MACDTKMFLSCEALPKNVKLWADPNFLIDISKTVLCVQTLDVNVAIITAQQTNNNIDEGRLPSSVMAEDREQLALLHLKADFVESSEITGP